MTKTRRDRHGETRSGKWSKEYRAFQNMRTRTGQKSHDAYEHYRSRGIEVCERWLGEHGFEHFLADVGRAPTPEHWLERFDNDRGYEPGNVGWATRTEQQRNKTSNRIVEYRGEERCLAEWCELLGLPYGRTYARLYRYCWDVDRALAA